MAPLKRTIYHYSRPFKGGIREGVLLRLESENGRVGWGEIAPLPGFSTETLEEALEDLIKGTDSPYPSVQWGQAAAMLDLMEPMEIDTIPIRILEKEKIKMGHLTLKEAIKKTEESDPSGVDMNQQWKLKEALHFAKLFDKLDYFEEPLQPGEKAAAFPYPVALDESLRKGEIPPYPLIKMHIIKPMLQGYPLPKKIKGVDFILSSSYESELGIYQLAKLAYRLQLPLKPMGLGTCHLFEKPLFEEEPYYKNGLLHFPKKWRLKMDKVQVVFNECI